MILSKKSTLILLVVASLITVAFAKRSNHEASSSNDYVPNDHKTESFVDGFLSSTAMILISEIGDKTFFIAAIMAFTHNKFDIFFAAVSSLYLMTILSAIMGMALPMLIPAIYTHYASCILFILFGLKLLYDAIMHEDNEGVNEELEEVRQELKNLESAESVSTKYFGDEPNSAVEYKKHQGIVSKITTKIFSPIFLQCATMTFLAEWGDRSQISTIALAASKNPIGVILGGCLGHTICTFCAVIGGAALASKISERTMHLIGGALFLFFAITGFLWPPTD